MFSFPSQIKAKKNKRRIKHKETNIIKRKISKQIQKITNSKRTKFNNNRKKGKITLIREEKERKISSEMNKSRTE